MDGDLPQGLVYRPEFLSPEEEDTVIELLERLGFTTVEMRGQIARRTVRHFGFRYDYGSRILTPADPIPQLLEPIRSRAEELAGLEPGSFMQLLAQRYPPGAPIGWHRDSAPFGVVAGISLGAASRMRFRRGEGGEREVREVLLEPRSAYVLGGEARTRWQHQIPPVKELRYSLTFRSLRRPERWAQAAESSETSDRTAASASGSSE